MKTKIAKILYDMRTQPLIGWVTIIGTALSIFLIMILVMMQQVSILSFAPETHRDRMLYGMYIHIGSLDGQNDGSAGMSYELAKKLYDGLDGVEIASYNYNGVVPCDAMGTTRMSITVDRQPTDDNYWRIYDFDLIEGRYYDAAEVEAGRPLAVICESVARSLFGEENPIGQHFMLDYNDFEVIGVVGDVSPLASMAYGEVFTPLDVRSWDPIFGDIEVNLLVKDGVDFDHVRDQVVKRYAELDSELAPEGRKTVYHGSPFDQETIASGVGGSNITPDPESGRIIRLFIYIVLLIAPAINLSSMLHSRLRHRVNEIGVERAFGCTRRRIISDIISESFIVTVVGGIIGLIAAIAFTTCYGGLFSDFGDAAVSPSLSILLRPQIFAYALGACFILNIISAAVPAWQASRLNPVEALNAR